MQIPNLMDVREDIQRQVIGQTNVINAVTACAYKFLLKQFATFDDPALETQSPNLLIRGRSGTGKTYIVKLACQALGIQYVEINSKSISQEGWHGTSFPDLIEDGLKSIENPNAPTMIVLDEFDKIIMPLASSKTESLHHVIQQSLLKYIEGHSILINKKAFNTKNFCFIFVGAFYDLMPEEKPLIGFDQGTYGTKDIEIADALIEYGMLPELAGRITSFVETDAFTTEMFMQLIKSDCFSYNKWVSIFSKINIDLLKPDNLQEICDEAVRKKLGARGLSQILDKELSKQIEANASNFNLQEYYDQLHNRHFLRTIEALGSGSEENL